MPSGFDFSAVSAAIRQVRGGCPSPMDVTPMRGGSISDAYRLTLGANAYFVKINTVTFADNFVAETSNLEALASAAVLPAPTFVCRGCTDGVAFLVLDFLPLQPLDSASGVLLGERLAQLHRHSWDQFGWPAANFIGRTPQENTPHASWPYFFGHRRLLPQLRLAAAQGMESRLIALGERVVDQIGGLFIGYSPPPSLLHGDLWSGNAARLPDGVPVIFDPACYYGDREADLAMCELFGGFPESFYAAYRSSWPLDAGYETRKTLYNLYHVLNHYHLFGDAYLGQARRMIERLAADLRR